MILDKKSIVWIIKDILPKKIKIAYIVICITAIGVNFLEGIGVGLIIPMLEVLSKGSELEKHGYFVRQILQSFQYLGIHPTVLSFMIIIFTLISLRYTAALLQAKLIDTTLHRTTKILKDRAFDNLMNVSIEYYHLSKVGELTNYLTSESMRGAFVIRSIIYLLSTIILAIFYIGILAVFSLEAMLIILVISLISFIAINKIITRTRELGIEKSDFNSRINVFCMEVFNSITLIKSFLLEKRIKEMFHRLTEDIRKNWVDLSFSRRFLEYLGVMIQITSMSLLIFFLVEIIHFSIGYLIGTLFILFRLLPFINFINNYRQEITENIPGLKNIYNLCLTENKPYIKSGSYKIERFKDRIEFKDVSFIYPTGKRVLDSVSFTINKGETVGIIGSSGGGKSTLIFLIPRFYDVSEGMILVNGIDLRLLDLYTWRSKIGIITQETFIFNDTIKNNLLLIKPDASDKDLQRVLELSYSIDFVRDMHDGIDTIVGDRGVKLSGGQKQRLAIARVFLKNPEILILDEATSALDSISELLIQQSIEELRKERTVIIVAHRLSTIKNTDRIIVLENGVVVEEGSHEELLQKRSQYYRYLQHSGVWT